MRCPAAAPFALLVAALVVTATPARGDPQWNVALVAGIAGTGTTRPWQGTRFHGGFRSDILFGRKGPRDLGFGPALELSTVGLSDGRLAAGPAVLIPLGELLAVEASPAAFVRTGPVGITGGVGARAFVGVRSYNYTGGYSLGGGLLAGLDQDLGGDREHALVIAAQVDGLVLVLPAILLYEWLRGPPSGH